MIFLVGGGGGGGGGEGVTPLKTLFQSISGRLPEAGRKKEMKYLAESYPASAQNSTSPWGSESPARWLPRLTYHFCHACKAEARHMYCFFGVVVVGGVCVNFCRVFA